MMLTSVNSRSIMSELGIIDPWDAAGEYSAQARLSFASPIPVSQRQLKGISGLYCLCAMCRADGSRAGLMLVICPALS